MYKILAIALTLIVLAICVITEVAFIKKKNVKETTDADEVRKEKSIFDRVRALTEKPFVALVILALMFIVFVASRVFHLGVTPTGFHIDECGMAYDAVCLSKTGCDRWGYSMPVYLCNFHTGQSVLFAYTVAALLKVFPFSITIARLPAVIYASVAFLAMFYIGKTLSGKNLGGFASSALMLMTPYFVTSERWALDCNLFLSLAIISFALVIYALKKDKTLLYLVAGFALALTLYTYILSYIVIPVFAVVLIIFILRKSHNKNGILKAAALLIPIVVMGIPLLLAQLVNLGMIPEFRFLGTDYIAFSEERVNEFYPAGLLANIGLFSKQLVFGDDLTYNCMPEFGAVLLPMLPLCVYGLYLSVKKIVLFIRHKDENSTDIKNVVIRFNLYFFIISYFVYLIVAKPNLNRGNELFMPLVIFAFVAIDTIYEAFINKSGKAKMAPVLIPTLSVCICFVFFAKFYYCDMNDVYGNHLLFVTNEVSKAVEQAEKLYDPNHDKKFYMEIEYGYEIGQDLLISAYTGVDAADWRNHEMGVTPDNIGRFNMHFTDESMEEDNVIYIIGNSWSFISDYLQTIGYNADRSFYNYVILYK